MIFRLLGKHSQFYGEMTWYHSARIQNKGIESLLLKQQMTNLGSDSVSCPIDF